MPQRFSGLSVVAIAVFLAWWILPGAAQAEEALSDFTQPALQDFTAKAVITQKNADELRKIGKSFAQGYRFHESRVQYKEPFKLRVDAKAGLFSVRYIINGTRKVTQVPGLHLNFARDITGHPGEKQGMLDAGVLTPAFLADAVAFRFLGRQPLDGRMLPVFEFWYTADVRSRHHTLWIDPEKRVILRHDVDDRHGHPWVRYLFKQPIQVAGVWMPSQVEVYSAEGHLAAVTRYDQVRVNTGLSESLFRP